jgi:hypothetical protein
MIGRNGVKAALGGGQSPKAAARRFGAGKFGNAGRLGVKKCDSHWAPAERQPRRESFLEFFPVHHVRSSQENEQPE